MTLDLIAKVLEKESILLFAFRKRKHLTIQKKPEARPLHLFKDISPSGKRQRITRRKNKELKNP